jgi:hypothetical protein
MLFRAEKRTPVDSSVFAFGFRPAFFRGCASSKRSTNATRSVIDQSRSVTLAAIAGVMPTVLCIFTTL